MHFIVHYAVNTRVGRAEEEVGKKEKGREEVDERSHGWRNKGNGSDGRVVRMRGSNPIKKCEEI